MKDKTLFHNFSLVLSKSLAISMLILVVLHINAAENSSNSSFPIIEADLNAGIFKKILPFDVPFMITGKITDNIIEVSVRYFESDSVINNQTIQQAKWIDIKPWHRFIGFEGDKFNLLIPPLKANRYFLFEFSFKRTVTDTEIEAFRREAIDIVDSDLRLLKEVTYLTVDQSEKLRKQLIAAIKSPGAKIAISAEPGSIFDENANSNDVTKIFNRHLTAILNAQNNKYEGIKGFGDFVNDATTLLVGLISNKALNDLVYNLHTRACEDNKIALLLKANAEILELFQLPSNELINLAAGSELGSPPVNLYPIWDPVELDNRINRLQETINTLNKMNRFIAQIHSISSLQRAAGVTANKLTDPIEIIGRSIENFHETLNELKYIKESLQRRKEEIENYIHKLGDQVRNDVVINGTSVGDFNTRHGWYVSADVGLAWAPNPEEVFPYFGINIYFRPINKDAPLRGFQFSRRFSIMLGITLKDLSKEGQRENVIGDQMLVIGTGFRFSDSMRLAGGMLIFKKPESNSQTSNADLAWSPFVSLSFDWDIASTLGSLGRALGITE